MGNSTHRKQSALRALMSVMAVILLFGVCLIGLLVTGYGLLLIH